ncbi:MAG: helix-turn-helix transcriptional regulator [Oscillospiraceae bacterium]|nr:helix-turn-helix transcriptional regulator [Oscillospiraceae bacterium]
MISKKDMHAFEDKHRILLQANEFICLRPHPSLREYISNYNITFPTKNIMPDGFTLMPSGCPSLTIASDGRNLSVDLDGPTITPYIVNSQAKQPEMLVTIEFRPAGLYAITGISQSELTDMSLPFDTVSPTLSKLILDAVEQAESVHELATRLDDLLLANVRTAYRPELMLALHDIKAYAGNISVKQLSNNSHYSERQLNRIFNQFVGTGTKSFSRLMRINNTFRLFKDSHKSLTYISDVTGFHDLSHFINDFKLVCGVTPQEYRNNMSVFYNNPTRF